MGEYYNWINVDKKVYICPGDFDYGNKFHESMHKDSIPLHTKNDFLDPLPILMGYGRVTEPGEWLGDIIDVSDSRPERYSLIEKLYVDW